MLNKIIFTILGIGIAFVFFPHTSYDNSQNGSVSGVATQKAEAHPEKAAPEMALNLSAPILTAHSAVAFDLNSGTILYSKNLDQQLPIASLTKLMTAIVTVKNADLNAVVTVRRQDLTYVGSTVGLVEGEKIKVIDLIKAMIIPSGNDAALALAGYVAGTPEKFSEMMNEEAKKLNLVATNFSNPVGWDKWGDKDNFSSSLDIIKIAQEYLKYEQLRKISGTKQETVFSIDGKYVHNLRTTNQLLLDDPKVEGLKTGFTTQALGNLVILYNNNDNYILTVVINSQGRELDSRKLLDWILRAYLWQ